MNQPLGKNLSLTIVLALLATAAGCKSMTPGQLELVQPHSDRPHVGNVYLLRGFIGIWSYGIDHLGKKVNESGVRAAVYQEDQWPDLAERIIEQYKAATEPEPLVLVGHSYGADDTLKIAKRLEEHGMHVDLIVTLDPVTPPRVPTNVSLVYNIYQPSLLDGLPFFRGIALETETPKQRNLQNVNIRSERKDLLEPKTDHFNIEKNVLIHAEVVRKVKEFCPPREVWAARQAAIRNTSAMRRPAAPGSPQPGGGIVEPPRLESRRTAAKPSDLDRIP
jgi:pimeloyl-ACP methyl ester carboxylesterase